MIEAAAPPVRPTCGSPAVRERGVALAIVVWFIAGMSILVLGIVAQAKVDTRLAQLHADRARVVASGDGAIRLLVAALAEETRDGRGAEFASERRFRVGEQVVEVSLYPLEGLVDLNTVDATLFRKLLVAAAGLSPRDAAALANSLVEWRVSRGRPKSGGNRLESPEDLLRVPGFSRAIYESLRDFVYAGSPGGSTLDPAVAPGLLRDVARGSVALARQRARVSLGERILSGRGIRVDAIIESGERRWVRRQWLRRGSGGDTRLPWHPVRVEPPRIMTTTGDQGGRA